MAKLNKDGSPRKPRGPNKKRTNPDAPGAAGVAGVGHNSKPEHNLTPDQQRQLFLSHRTAWNQWQAQVAAVDKAGIDVKAALKRDGFTVKQFQIADGLGTLKGEARIQGEVKDRLQVARWMGHPLGAQFDLFSDAPKAPANDPRPSTDRAYDLGKMASMENRSPKPQDHNIAPGTPEYEHYMAGYQDHQRELAGGIKAPGDAGGSTMAGSTSQH